MRSVALPLFIGLVGCFQFLTGGAHAQQADSSAVQQADSSAARPIPPSAPPPARAIPGITAPDLFPKGCIDCHINMPEQNLDTRFSTLLRRWAEEIEPALLVKAQAAAPEGLTLKGKHPSAKSSLRDIPAGCFKCHRDDSKKAPPFSKLMHRIHMVGGEENHFMTIFQGECTHCHKLNAETGAWSIPSAPEP